MKSQYNNLAAILSLGISKKTVDGADLSQADWGMLEPFLVSNHLEQITRRAFAMLCTEKQPLPPAEVVARFMDMGVRAIGNHVVRLKSTRAFSAKWVKDGWRPLAIGGMAYRHFYQVPALRNDDTLVCVPLCRNAPGDVKVDAFEAQTIDYPELRIEVPSTAVGPFSTNPGEEADAILRSVFFGAPCELDSTLGLAYPNPEFMAVYHLYTAQQLLLHSRVPFIMLVDWIMLLDTLVVRTEQHFDWATFREHINDLGLLRFTQCFTVLAQRMTGVALAGSVAWLTENVTDKDVNYLYECLVADAEPDSAPAEDKGRFSRFVGVLRNSKKYSRFSDVSPAKQAFRYLFS